jgi:hypothetical protein
VTSGADGAFAFHSPAGGLLAPDSPREVVDDALGWLREWADERKLELGPEVNMPQWDGKTPDYNSAVANAPEYGCSDGCWRLASSRWRLRRLVKLFL